MFNRPTRLAVVFIGGSVASLLAVDGMADVPPYYVQTVVATSPTYVDIPPARQELRAPTQEEGLIWVPGRWERAADDWKWHEGQWVQMPFSNAYWMPGYWEHHEGEFQWQAGHWAAADQGVVVQEPIAIPEPYVEQRPIEPDGSGWVWQPGHWAWRGTWVWVPGEYVRSGVQQAVWKQGEWEAAPGGQWQWNPAHWAAQ